MDKAILKAKKLVKPQKTNKNAQETLTKLNEALKTAGINAEAVLGGSIAKKTNLKDKYDIDIFVRFHDSKKDISNQLEKAMKKLKEKYVRVHGSRDYFQIKKDYLYEIVPVLKVTNSAQAQNVSDMSPLHVQYFNKKAKNKPGIRDEIRITKRFMQAARVYGAESYIKGFSGHVTDLLIIHYGSFKELINKAKNWKEKKIIDIEKHHKFPMLSLNESKLQSPLIVVDPVQPQRNAAAALSEENYKKFISACRKFERKPSIEFFKTKPFKEIIQENNKKDSDLYIFDIKPLKDKRDVSGEKVLKVKERIEKELGENDFEILWSDWDFSEENATIAISIKKGKLTETKEIEGPELSMKEHIKRFKDKYKKTKTKNGRLYSQIKRKYTQPDKLIEKIINSSYVKEKVKGIACANK